MRTLRCCLSESSLPVGQLKSYDISTGPVHVKTIVAFITRVQYLAETLLRKIRRGKRQYYLLAIIIASIFPKVLENAHCTPLDPTI